MKFLVTLCVVFLWAEATNACSPVFSTVEYVPGPEQARLLKSGEYSDIPKPIISNLAVTRGTAGSDGYSCDDLGTISFEFSVPDEAKLDLHDVGLLVRVVRGDDTDAIFHETAVMPFPPEFSGDTSEKRKSDVYFHWLDGAPEHQRTLDYELEVLFVGPGNIEGPPLTLSILSTPRPVPRGLSGEEKSP